MIGTRLTIQAYIDGILASNRVVLSQAITLTESYLPSDRELAQQVLEGILPYTGKSLRIGITGVPGVGKSTFIETFGLYVASLQKKIAVLAIDPTSQLSKGSIMGDKTRMEILSNHRLAYIRPSPTGNSLGGVAARTRESILLCEAAGYEVVMIETVGVGQSETMVKSMTDFFLLLMLAGAGDELQGIKKGIMEMTDVIAITKADGNNTLNAQQAQAEYQSALRLFAHNDSDWQPQVLTCSATTNKGIVKIWQTILMYQDQTKLNGFFDKNRQQQNIEWLHNLIKQTLQERFYTNPTVQEKLIIIENQVLTGDILPLNALKILLG